MTLANRALVIACLAGLAGSASAGLIDVTITGALAPSNSSLLVADGTWDRGTAWGSGDWGGIVNTPTTGAAWANELWIGMAPVSLNINVISDGDPDVTIQKNLTNTTGVAWTSFKIDLLEFVGFGPITVLAGSEASNRFGNVATTNFGSGNAEMIFSLAGLQTAVLPGQSVSFFFTFNVPGAVAFKMVQSPIPTPGVLALMGLGGMIVARRRR